MTKFPVTLTIRITEDDAFELDDACEEFELPRSILLRRIWRDWFRARKKQQANGRKSAAIPGAATKTVA